MNSQRSPFQVVWKSSIIVLLVLLAFQSFGINGLAAPTTPSFHFQEGGNPQLACSTSPTPLQFCDIQIVLLIDDSGSMKFNDPQGIRNRGAKNLVDFLATQYYLPAKEYLESVKSTNDPPVIEISVVHFTTKVEDVEDFKDWKQVEPKDLDDWKNKRVAFDGAIAWNDPVEQNTDFKDPFDKAAGLLTSLNTQAKDEGCTKRLILLFTDGTPQNGGYIDVDKKMFEVESIVDNIPLDLNVEIYVTGFKVKDNYWDKVENHWSRIVGSSDEQDPPRSVLLKDKDGENPLNLLGIRMEKIVAHSIGFQSADIELVSIDPPTYTIEIPEYVQTLRLTLYNLDHEAGLVITGPDSDTNEIVAGNENVILSGQDTSIEVWQLDTPIAGRYKVKPSQSGGIVTAFLTFQNLAVKVDSDASRLQVSKPGDIKFKLVDSSGNDVLPNDNPSYTLEGLNVFVTQGTQIEKQPLEWEQEGDSYQVSWTPQSSETFQLDISAKLVSVKGNTLVNCAGVVEVPVNQNPPPPTLHVTPLAACVSPDVTITLPVQLDYEGDRAWVDTLDWNVSADGQNISATVSTIDASKGQYELRIDPLKGNGVEEIQLMVSAEAVIDGQTVNISDSTTSTIKVCSTPPTPCDCTGGFPIWLIFIWLMMWLGLLLLGWIILRDKKINIKFWLLVFLEFLLAAAWFIFFSKYLIYLLWMLLLIILLIIMVYIFRKVIKDISWWLIFLVNLFVSIWFVIFGGFPFWLILLLMLMWLGFLILLWVFNMPEPPFWRWLLLALLLILALLSLIIFSAYLIYLLLWLLAILILTLVILVIGPICPPTPSPPADDLKELEGIEGDVEKLLNDHGVTTFRQLAETDIRQLNDWLNENDWNYMDPKTWPQQAKLADIAKRYGQKTDEQSYKAYKKWLKNGIEPDEYIDKEKVRRPEALVWRGTAELTEKDNPEIFNIDF